jgi:tRNA(Ile2)-agmatinylcytidine synthase
MRRRTSRSSGLWIGVDDTDSRQGGCTTYVLTEIVRVARERGFDLIGEPRLVRLNPNIPWKTRGNAALSARFGYGRGHRRRIGEIEGRPVFAYPRSGSVRRAEADGLIKAAWTVVEHQADRRDARTDPALVAGFRVPPASFYWQAVREVVGISPVRRWLRATGTYNRTEGSRRGLVGAVASLAWREAHPTWELLTYRTPERIGSRRAVSVSGVQRAAKRWPHLFLCHDRRTRRLLVAPHTACPILFGLRSTDPRSPIAALGSFRSEPIERWLLFRTNQGTGDHLVPRSMADFAPYTAGRLIGRVAESPLVRPGGHVSVTLRDSAGNQIDCIAFEPTKTLPRLAQTLRPGDRVRIWGSRARDSVCRIEGIEVLSWGPRWSPLRPPRCPACRRSASSIGAHKGYRCPGCGARFPPESASRIRLASPSYPLGVYHPTPSARRHLAPRGPEA